MVTVLPGNKIEENQTPDMQDVILKKGYIATRHGFSKSSKSLHDAILGMYNYRSARGKNIFIAFADNVDRLGNANSGGLVLFPEIDVDSSYYELLDFLWDWYLLWQTLQDDDLVDAEFDYPTGAHWEWDEDDSQWEYTGSGDIETGDIPDDIMPSDLKPFPGDTFDGTTIDTSIWNIFTVGNGAVTPTQDEHLILQLVANTEYSYCGIDSGDLISYITCPGDFDISIDYELISFPTPDNGIKAIWFAMVIDGDNQAYMYRSDETGVGNVYSGEIYNAGGYDYAATSTSDTSGKFRITRVGSIIKVYYWNNGWVALNSDSSFSTAEGYLFMGLEQFGNDSNSAETRYDNLVTSGAYPV